jgi:hypothetical protein
MDVKSNLRFGLHGEGREKDVNLIKYYVFNMYEGN